MIRIQTVYKIDELPEPWDVLIGKMSFVGPRPDVPGYADKLEGEDRLVLKLRPGITGPATLKYRDEEDMIAGWIAANRGRDGMDDAQLAVWYYKGQATSCRTRTNLPHCDKSMAQSSVERILRLAEGKSVFPGHEVV